MALTLFAGYHASAQGKISPSGQIILEEFDAMALKSNTSQAQPTYAAIITLSDESAAQQLRDAGIDIISDLGTVITADIPLNRMYEVSEMPGVVYVSFGEYQNANMNFARSDASVEEAQNGFSYNEQTLKFDGTGVIAGLMDTGMDANHCNFKDDSNASRIERLWWFRSNNGTATQYTSSTISSFTTDNTSQSHATHVGGIMAGSYKGTGQVAQLTNPATGAGVTVGASNVPYYGVATGARLAFSVGSLSDANIINGVTNIINYAENQGMPCVVNLSLGSNSGPHDGSTSFNAALAKLGERGIICVSSGNEGDDPLYVFKEFTSSSDDLKTMIAPSCITNGKNVSNIVDVWGGSNQVLQVSWAVYNSATKALTTLATISGANQSTSISSSNASFNAAFSGSIRMASEINPLNNRFHVQCSLSSVARKTTATTSYLALVVKAVNGEKVYVYGGGIDVTFTSNNIVGWTNGSADGSINDTACGENIISVGAYTSAQYFPTLSRSVLAYQGATAPGTIAPFSSYGYTFEGTPKPDVTAPGTVIISSYSRYYYAAQGLTSSSVTASAARSGVTNYWGPMQGTSMSCPFVSGVVALWLQANPSLKYSDIIETIKESSDFNSFSMRPAIRWGAGKINAVEGLKHILGKTSIGSVWNDEEQRLIITPLADGYEVWVAASKHVKATLYSLAGIAMTTANADGECVNVSTSSLPKGVYILSVDSDAGRHTSKVTVK